MSLLLQWCTISELCILNNPIPLSVADKILKYHISPMTPVRGFLGFPVTASQRSGFRPKSYELGRGRSGGSQHTFEDDGEIVGRGAVDWTTPEPKDLKKLFDAICKFTPYTRVCIYPSNGFIHCDYKNEVKDRWTYKCSSPVGAWERVAKLPSI